MRVLTLCEPWASALVFGPKRIENRPVAFKHRGPVAIHSGLNDRWFTPEAITLLARTWSGFPNDPVAAKNYLRPRMGTIIGVVDLTDCYAIQTIMCTGSGDPFAFGPWCHVTERPRALRHPIPFRGQQGMAAQIDDVLIEAAGVVDVPPGSGFKWGIMTMTGPPAVSP